MNPSALWQLPDDLFDIWSWIPAIAFLAPIAALSGAENEEEYYGTPRYTTTIPIPREVYLTWFPIAKDLRTPWGLDEEWTDPTNKIIWSR